MRIDLTRERIEAEYRVACELGFIDVSDFKEILELYDSVKGLTPYYGAPVVNQTAYFLKQLVMFKLLYVGGCAHCGYREITASEIEGYFDSNRDLFTRYFGESFTLEEVSDVIRKRIREEDYEKLVHKQLEGK